MPRKLYDADNNEVEVLTDEEIQTQVSEASEKAKEEGKKEAEEAFATERAELEQAANPNWKEAREKMKKMGEALKAKGVKVTKDFEIEEDTQTPTPEEVQQQAEEAAGAAARKELVGSHLKRVTSQLNDEQREVFDKYYKKLTTDEDVTLENVDQFVSEAARAAFPDAATNPLGSAISSPPGQPPTPKTGDKENFADTTQGQDLAKDLDMNLGQEKKDEQKNTPPAQPPANQPGNN